MEKIVPSNPFSLVEFQITHSAKDGLTTKLDFTFRDSHAEINISGDGFGEMPSSPHIKISHL